MLSYWNQHRLVVRGRIDGGQFIVTGRKTTGDYLAHNSIDSGTVHSCEEGKCLRVDDSSLVKVRNFLNDEMRVTSDLALRVELLGGSEVTRIGIDKITRFQVFDGHLNSEILIRFHNAKVCGGNKFA